MLTAGAQFDGRRWVNSASDEVFVVHPVCATLLSQPSVGIDAMILEDRRPAGQLGEVTLMSSLPLQRQVPMGPCRCSDSLKINNRSVAPVSPQSSARFGSALGARVAIRVAASTSGLMRGGIGAHSEDSLHC